MDRCIRRIACCLEGGLERLASEGLLLRALMVLAGLATITGDIEGKAPRKVKPGLLKRLPQFAGPSTQL